MGTSESQNLALPLGHTNGAQYFRGYIALLDARVTLLKRVRLARASGESIGRQGGGGGRRAEDGDKGYWSRVDNARFEFSLYIRTAHLEVTTAEYDASRIAGEEISQEIALLFRRAHFDAAHKVVPRVIGRRGGRGKNTASNTASCLGPTCTKM